MPLEEIRGISPGCRVVARQQRATVGVGPALLGRVVDGLGLRLTARGRWPPSRNTPYMLRP